MTIRVHSVLLTDLGSRIPYHKRSRQHRLHLHPLPQREECRQKPPRHQPLRVTLNLYWYSKTNRITHTSIVPLKSLFGYFKKSTIYVI